MSEIVIDEERHFDEQRHYFCITFRHEVNHAVSHSNVYVSLSRKRITKNFLEEIVHDIKFVNEIVISISYMGHMTQEEFLYD